MFSPEPDTYVVVVDVQSACRLCLEPGGALAPAEPALLRQAEELLGLQIVEDQNLPGKICHRCRYKLELFQEFKNTLIETQKTLREYTTVDVNDEISIVKELATNESQPAEYPLFTEEYDRNEQNEKTEMIYTEHENSSNHKFINNEFSGSELNLSFESTNAQDIKEDISEEKYNRDHNDKDTIEYPSMMVALKNNQCLLCFEECGDRKSLQEHVEKHLDGSLLEPYYLVADRDILCKACGRAFDYRYSFVEHQRQHLNIKPFVCVHDDCGLSFHSKAAWTNHLPKHAERNFICSTCGMGFKRKSALKVHTIIHKDEGGTFTCPVCGMYCKNRLTCASHMKTHTSVPKHKCQVCSKDYYSQSELKRHMLSHSENKQFNCNTCGRAYYSKSALIRHSRDTGHTLDSNIKNSTDKQHISARCRLMFENRVTCKTHVCSHNLPHQCGDCDKTCTTKEVDMHLLGCQNKDVALNLTNDRLVSVAKE